MAHLYGVVIGLVIDYVEDHITTVSTKIRDSSENSWAQRDRIEAVADFVLGRFVLL